MEESKSLTRLWVECVKPRDFEPAEPFVIQGKPYIDERGDFVVLTAQDLPPDISVWERAAKEVEKDPKISKSALAKKLGVSRNNLKVPGWRWKDSGRTTGEWEPDILQPESEEGSASGF